MGDGQAGLAGIVGPWARGEREVGRTGEVSLSRTVGGVESVGAVPVDAVHPLTREAWRAWLAEHHGRGSGVWLVSYKKATGLARFGYDAAVEEALCFGWVDSKANKLDAARSMLWFAPRKPRTGWSRPNKLRIEKMTAAGLMAEAGLAKVRAAQAEGRGRRWMGWRRWRFRQTSWPRSSGIRVRRSGSRRFRGRRSGLEWIVVAKRAETRAARVEETARLAARGERANQWKPPAGAAGGKGAERIRKGGQ